MHLILPMPKWRTPRRNNRHDRLFAAGSLWLLLALAATSVAAADNPAEEPTPTPTPETSTPTPTSTPIPEELFIQKLSRWAYINFAQIGPFKEATVRDLESSDLWQVEEGDLIEDLEIVGVENDSITVRIGGREGKLELIAESFALTIIEDDFGPYTWNTEDGPPNIVEEIRFRGKAAFEATGNNRLEIPNGSEPKVSSGETGYSRLNVAIYLIQPVSDILIQAHGRKKGWTRWGFDAEPTYRVGFPWPPMGTTTGLQRGQWHYFSIDLIEDLGIEEGDQLVELAFTSQRRRALFDSVSLSRSVPPGATAVRKVARGGEGDPAREIRDLHRMRRR